MAKLVDLDGLKYFYSKIKAMLALKADDNAVVKSVNGTTPDSSGNVSVAVGGGSGGGVSTDTANTWTAAQTFNSISKHKMEYAIPLGGIIKPTTPSICCVVDRDITLNLDALCSQVADDESMIFRAYIFCGSDSSQYTLTIEGIDGAALITGDNTDYAISKWGMILTAYINKSSGNSDPMVLLSATKLTGAKG